MKRVSVKGKTVVSKEPGEKRLNWDEVVELINTLPKKWLPIMVKMGSPNSAQMTAHRVKKSFDGIDVCTRGANVVLNRAA